MIIKRLALLFNYPLMLDLSLIIFAINIVYCQTEERGALSRFRGAVWGSSIEDVKASEAAEYMQSFHGFGLDALSYKGHIAGLQARIDYSFKNGKLFEGAYSINTEEYFKDNFDKLKNFLTDNFGKPDFRAGRAIESDSVWIKVTDYGKFKGPELYWKFTDGFIALIASKFESEITLTVLYSKDKSIESYGKDRLISTDNFVK
jgi:hypothetical protein